MKSIFYILLRTTILEKIADSFLGNIAKSFCKLDSLDCIKVGMHVNSIDYVDGRIPVPYMVFVDCIITKIQSDPNGLHRIDFMYQHLDFGYDVELNDNHVLRKALPFRKIIVSPDRKEIKLEL